MLLAFAQLQCFKIQYQMQEFDERGKAKMIIISSIYHPTSGLMQILHFNWLHYCGKEIKVENGVKVPKS